MQHNRSLQRVSQMIGWSFQRLTIAAHPLRYLLRVILGPYCEISFATLYSKRDKSEGLGRASQVMTLTLMRWSTKSEVRMKGRYQGNPQ